MAAVPPDELTPERLRERVGHICQAFPRRNVWNLPSLNGCRDWIESKLRADGYAPERQEVEAEFWTDERGTPARATVHNLVVRVPGLDPELPRLVVGAHYDARHGMEAQYSRRPVFDRAGLDPEFDDTTGANDNASGVAALLELLRCWRGRPRRRSLEAVFWVNEEHPFFRNSWADGRRVNGRLFRASGMGSPVHAATLDPRHVLGAIAFDSMGCYDDRRGYASRADASWPRRMAFAALFPGDHRFVAFLSNRRSSAFVREAARLLPALGGAPRLFPLAVPLVDLLDTGWSDDWSYWRRGIPAFCVTDTAYVRSRNYHRTTDTPDTLNYPVFAALVRALGAMVDGLLEGEGKS